MAVIKKNPFTPVFGNDPLVFIGREKLVDDVLGGLVSGPGDPNRTTIFTGPRGSGKTVLMNRIAQAAEGMGWIAVHVMAETGMLESIVEQLERKAATLLPKKGKSRITGTLVPGVGGVNRQMASNQQSSWRVQMDTYLDILAERGVGLMITIDEVTAGAEELVSFVSTFQFFIREQRNVALLMAGLPHEVLQIFNDRKISYIRRAFMRRLEPLPINEVRVAMREAIEDTARSIEPAALKKAADETLGMPFMVQLVGYHVFNQSTHPRINMDDVDLGILSAKEDMKYMVLDATWQELTAAERRYLVAMLPDGETSRTADLTKRLNISASSTSHYKRRLVERGVLYDAGRGSVAFSMPLMKELMEEYKI